MCIQWRIDYLFDFGRFGPPYKVGLDQRSDIQHFSNPGISALLWISNKLIYFKKQVFYLVSGTLHQSQSNFTKSM